MVLWILLADSRFRLRDFHALWSAFPKQFSYLLSIRYAVRNPKRLRLLVWPLSLSLAATQEIDTGFPKTLLLLGGPFFFLFLPLLRCFSSRRFPYIGYLFTYI